MGLWYDIRLNALFQAKNIFLITTLSPSYHFQDWDKNVRPSEDNHGYFYTDLPNTVFGMLKDTVSLPLFLGKKNRKFLQKRKRSGSLLWVFCFKKCQKASEKNEKIWHFPALFAPNFCGFLAFRSVRILTSLASEFHVNGILKRA